MNNPAPSNLRLSPMGGLDGNNSYNSVEELQSGQRSPAESDRSNFTSVSQRGINPRWNGGGQGYGAQPLPNRKPIPRRDDMLLNANPDFALPNAGRGARGPPRVMRGGMTPNSAYPGAAGI
jgi:hypothetical protein